MSERLSNIAQSIQSAFGNATGNLRYQAGRIQLGRGRIIGLVLVAALVGGGYALVKKPPFQGVGRDEVGIRVNTLSGEAVEFRDGMVFVVPGIHQMRRYSLRDQRYQPSRSGAPFQSLEGLALGVDLTIRYALDPSKISSMAKNLPADLNGEIVEPQVQAVIYKVFASHTVREIFSAKRAQIQSTIEAELKPRLAADGIILRGVMMGKVELPADYRAGLDKLLAEELETEKMRYTLELKEKRVKQNELEGEAQKVSREKAAEAAGSEQVIAAKAQAEAMKHVLPFKQKQIEQRQLEAEAEKITRIKNAEASAQARKIEAEGEAVSRQKLADAEVYRMDKVGRTSSEQLARDGATISKNPLLIQKALADKLSDKITVIIAPPPADGGFIGSTLLGGGQNTKAKASKAVQQEKAEPQESSKEEE